MSLPRLEEFSSGSQSEDESRGDLKNRLHQRIQTYYPPEELWRSSENHEMTEDEKSRVEQRKESNKQAARKSREKKAIRLKELEKKAKELRKQRMYLLEERNRINEQRHRLKALLKAHAQSCPGVKEDIRQRLPFVEL